MADISLHISDDHASAALRWFDTMRREDEWGLRVAEQLVLLGGIKRRTYQNWRQRALQGNPVKLPRDTLKRLSLLLGIYAGFKNIAPSDRPDLAKRWFAAPNTAQPFCGLSVKQYALNSGTIIALYSIRRYLDAACSANHLNSSFDDSNKQLRISIINLIVPLVKDFGPQMEYDAIRSVVDTLVPRGPIQPSLIHEVRMEARARIEVLNGAEWLTASEIAEHAGFGTRNLLAQLNTWKDKDAIFSISHAGAEYFPGYGFDKQNGYEPFTVMAKILTILGESKSGWGLAYWFWSPNSYLGGSRPQNMLVLHPDKVIAAAQAEANGIQNG